MTKFTTHGSIRGGCGHHHKHIHTALACIESDQRGCASQGGYSDRDVFQLVEVEGRLKRRRVSSDDLYGMSA